MKIKLTFIEEFRKWKDKNFPPTAEELLDREIKNKYGPIKKVLTRKVNDTFYDVDWFKLSAFFFFCAIVVGLMGFSLKNAQEIYINASTNTAVNNLIQDSSSSGIPVFIIFILLMLPIAYIIWKVFGRD